MTQTPVPDVPAAADSDVFITRAFAAPRDVVWRFFTEPGHLARWFGPAGVHVDRSSVVVEATAGGSWDLDMVDDETAERFPIRTRLTSSSRPSTWRGRSTDPPVR